MEAKITSHPPLSLRNVQTAEQVTNQNMDFFFHADISFLSYVSISYIPLTGKALLST